MIVRPKNCCTTPGLVPDTFRGISGIIYEIWKCPQCGYNYHSDIQRHAMKATNIHRMRFLRELTEIKDFEILCIAANLMDEAIKVPSLVPLIQD